MSENNNPLDEVYGDVATPQPPRRRRRSQAASSDTEDISVPRPWLATPTEDTPAPAAPIEVPTTEEPEVMTPVVDEPEVIEPVVDEPEVIEPEITEPVAAPVVEAAPAERHRRRRRRADAPEDDGTSKMEIEDDEDEVGDEFFDEPARPTAPAAGTTAAPRRRFNFTEGGGTGSGATSSGTTAPTSGGKPGGWGARFAKNAGSASPATTPTPAPAPRRSGGSRFGGGTSGSTSTGTRRTSTPQAPARTTTTRRPTTSRPAARSSAGAKVGKFFGDVIQGIFNFAYTAVLLVAFLVMTFGVLMSFAGVQVVSDISIDSSDMPLSSELNLFDYLVFSEYSILNVFIEAFQNIGDHPELFFYILMIGIPSIIFTVGFVKRTISGVVGLFTWNRYTLAGVVTGGVRATFMMLFMHWLAGASSAALDISNHYDSISYQLGEGLIAGVVLSLAALLITYVLSFFMSERNYMLKSDEIASAARMIAYGLMLAFLLGNSNGVGIIITLVYTLEDFNLITVGLTITLLVMIIRLYKTAAQGFAVNMACLHNTGESFGEVGIVDENPKTSVMKNTFINGGVALGAVVLLEIFELDYLIDFTFVLIPILVVAGVCAIICKICDRF